MHTQRLITNLLILFFILSGFYLPQQVIGADKATTRPVIIKLTQTPCLFIESEESPQEFSSNSAEDCVRINKETADNRKLKTLRLKPGKVIFRVENKNVPYELGFWLRGKGLGRLTLPTVSGGGITTGTAKDYVITLTPGEYLYSCPLNPTPDYTLIVE